MLQYPHELSVTPPTSAAFPPLTTPLPTLPLLPTASPPMPPVTPTSPTTPGNAEAVCEAAARLLFMNVKWVKHVPAFMNLPFEDQCLLLRESWRELFVLAAAQFQLPIDPALLFAEAGKLKIIE